MKDRTIKLLGLLEGILLTLAVISQFIVGFYNDQIEDINNKIIEHDANIIIGTNTILSAGIMSQLNKSIVAYYFNETYSLHGSNKEMTFLEILPYLFNISSPSRYVQNDLARKYASLL